MTSASDIMRLRRQFGASGVVSIAKGPPPRYGKFLKTELLTAVRSLHIPSGSARLKKASRNSTQWEDGQIGGTGFPDEQNYMIGMRFQSVSGTGEPEAN